MSGKTIRRIHAVLGVAVFSTITSIASANLTNVFAPPSGEATHAQIFSNVYGGVFAPGPNGAPAYTNGSVIATRIDDVLGSGGMGANLNLVFGTPGLPTTDQRCEDGIAITSAEAKFAGFSQEFGYDDGNGYVELFDVTSVGPTGYDVAGGGSHHFTQGVPWNWVRSGTGSMYFSEDARNHDQLDHLVTYSITGLRTSDTVWMLFWEDLPGGLRGSGNSDRDFNDLVVEIRANVANVVPVPGAALLGACGMGLVGLVKRRRNGTK